MEGSRFDAWTRRGFGVAASGLAGSLLAVAGIAGTEAKKKNKKKKKKCIKEVGATCNDNKKKCCCGYECREPIVVNGNGNGRECCRAAGFPADSSDECCSGRPLELGRCICKTGGQPCGLDHECCSQDCVDTGMGLRCAPLP